MQSSTQFHLLSFEGPDAYSRAGGLATRVDGLSRALSGLGIETHLWFIGDPQLPGHETHGALHLHRWGQWISRYHPGGVYEGELRKRDDYCASLPPYLLSEVLRRHLVGGGEAVVLAEEWQTVDAVLHLHRLLQSETLRNRASILWNANNTFGFDGIPWNRLRQAATITTVSRYMKHRMREHGVEALAIPNGLPPDAFSKPDSVAVAELRGRFRSRTLLSKMARWDPDKRWIGAIRIVAEMKRRGARPLLLARGGSEAHAHDVFNVAHQLGLRVVDRSWSQPGPKGLFDAVRDVNGADVVNLRSFVDADARRTLFRGSDAVLANSGHEPFGLVGLETMAAGGIACTGCSGEDYAEPGQNALVLETDDPGEFIGMFERLERYPEQARAMRRAGRATAARYAWSEVVRRILLPRVELLHPALKTQARIPASAA